MGHHHTRDKRSPRAVFALDFDGVLCDSTAETGVSSWRAGTRLWPEWQGLEPPLRFASRFRNLRPVIETGYEAVLLMRLIYDDVDDETVFARFPELCARLLRETGCSQADLTRLFSDARDEWIARDPEDWLGRQGLYPGVGEALAGHAGSAPVFIITNKEERFVSVLLRARGIRLPADHIFGLEEGRPKEDVLEELLRRPAFGSARFHFVEDRLKTLMRVAGRDSLAEVLLYLADWGYNTAADRERARSISRITIWNLRSFLHV